MKKHFIFMISLVVVISITATAVLFPSSSAKYIGRSGEYNMTLYAPRGDKIVRISGGYTHSLAISSSGQLYGWGNNGYGKIGDGTTTNRNLPIEIINASHIKFKYVAASEDHSLGIDYDGNLYSWGSASYGKLGNGSTSGSVTSPAKINIAGDPKFIKVEVVIQGSAALDDAGNIWTWGSNSNGFLGNGSTTGNRSVPAIVTNFTGESPFFTDVATSCYACYSLLAVDSEGNIWGWGESQYGELGFGANNTRNRPTPAIVYTAATGLWSATSGSGDLRQVVHLTPGTKMVSVAMGWGLGGAMDENGSIYTWGANNMNELGIGATNNGSDYPPKLVYNALTGEWKAPQTPDFGEPRKIVNYEMSAAGGWAIDELGNVFSWGYNTHGQLGIGSTSNQSYPIKMYDSQAGLFIGGASLPAGTEIVSAGGHRDHVFFLAENGELFAAGENASYRLGDGTITRRTTAVCISSGIAGSVFPLAILEWPII